ncbi:putative membrane protein [Escherichia coli 2-427-07_S3_C3]|nr:putative membrane protein [Escherichia coli 2-427-07_S3_C1]KDY31246.1 putative membrane protein [Escherichia coli 2-427-07_S3_C3]
MITALAWHFSESIYGWMLAITAIQDLAITSFIFSLCRR